MKHFLLIAAFIFSSPLYAGDFECSDRVAEAAMGMAKANMPMTGADLQIVSKVLTAKVKDGVKRMKIEAFRVEPGSPFPNCVYSPKIWLHVEYIKNEQMPWGQCVVRSTFVSNDQKKSDWLSSHCL